jgi:CheY-like chemotaxis protein
LTSQLLAFARRSVLQPKVVDVGQFVTTLTARLQRLVGPGIAVEIDHRAGDVAVRVDPGQLEHALLNLAVNARDAMPAGGSLSISTERLTPVDEGVAQVLIAVSDTGTGIVPEVQGHVFEPFFTTKAPGKGSGLGLAMVYGFVTQSGGDISVDSRPGRGTRVEIRLPMVGAEPQPRSTGPSRPVAARGGETVLVIDDEPAVAELARRVLSGAGYEVLVATNRATASKAARTTSRPIDLILSDVIMPGASGPEVAGEVRRLHPNALVLFASGYTAEAITERGILPKGVELLEKPYSAGDLTARVRRLLDERPGSAGDG